MLEPDPNIRKKEPPKSWGNASRRKPQCKGPQEPKEPAKQKAGQCAELGGRGSERRRPEMGEAAGHL